MQMKQDCSGDEGETSVSGFKQNMDRLIVPTLANAAGIRN
jgi:hypothetical protein